MKSVLFIEDNYSNFILFRKIFESNSFEVFPKKDEISSQSELSEFLGTPQPVSTYEEYCKIYLIELKRIIFEYINSKELYKKLSLIVLDINLTGESEDTLGLDLLSSIRMDFVPNDVKYLGWNSLIPVIALTWYNKDKYETSFLNYPGYLLGFYEKKVVQISSEGINTCMNSFHEQMSAIYPLFFDPALKIILKKVNDHERYLKEIKQISKLILFAEIAQMPPEKRKIFADNFTKALIKYCKENNAFMDDIDDAEKVITPKMSSFLTNPVKGLSVLSDLITVFSSVIKPNNISSVVEHIINIMPDTI